MSYQKAERLLETLPWEDEPYFSQFPSKLSERLRDSLERPDATISPCRLEGNMESFRRVGYHDFKAYTECVAGGKYQGFVLVRHHTLVGIVQTVFRAGRAAAEEGEAFANAEDKVVELMRLVSTERRRTGTG